MKTFREIAELHYEYIPSGKLDRQYRESRITSLEELLSEHTNQRVIEELEEFQGWVEVPSEGYKRMEKRINQLKQRV